MPMGSNEEGPDLFRGECPTCGTSTGVPDCEGCGDGIRRVAVTQRHTARIRFSLPDRERALEYDCTVGMAASEFLEHVAARLKFYAEECRAVEEAA